MGLNGSEDPISIASPASSNTQISNQARYTILSGSNNRVIVQSDEITIRENELKYFLKIFEESVKKSDIWTPFGIWLAMILASLGFWLPYYDKPIPPVYAFCSAASIFSTILPLYIVFIRAKESENPVTVDKIVEKMRNN